MRLVNRIRSNTTINKVIRQILLRCDRSINHLINKWRLSGNIALTINGHKFLMFSDCDDHRVNPIFYNRPYIETDDLNIFSQLICNDDTIFDVGANTGIYSLLSAVSATNTKVYSFEPQEANLRRLKRNIDLNEINNVVIVPKVVGHQKGKVQFTIPEEDILSDTSSAVQKFSKASYNEKVNWKTIEMDQVSIDSYYSENNISSVDAIKIDVEGYEINVLKGATQCISDCKPIILIETFIGTEQKEYLHNFAGVNEYYPYLILKEGLILVEDDFESFNNLNYLLLPYRTPRNFTPNRKLSELKSALKEARRAVDLQ